MSTLHIAWFISVKPFFLHLRLASSGISNNFRFSNFVPPSIPLERVGIMLALHTAYNKVLIERLIDWVIVLIVFNRNSVHVRVGLTFQNCYASCVLYLKYVYLFKPGTRIGACWLYSIGGGWMIEMQLFARRVDTARAHRLVLFRHNYPFHWYFHIYEPMFPRRSTFISKENSKFQCNKWPLSNQQSRP